MVAPGSCPVNGQDGDAPTPSRNRHSGVGPGAQSGAGAELTPVNHTRFFIADHPDTGYELRKSDGTTAGTKLVKDIDP